MTQSSRSSGLLMLGMCSLPLGTMERQLGNMAILIPTLDLLHTVAPGTAIRTSLQLSAEACKAYGVTSVPVRSWYEPNARSGIIAALDLGRALLWRASLRLSGRDLHWLLHGAKFREIASARAVLDFSGDTFGDMAHPLHLLKHALDLSTVLALGKPLVFFAQSPGPFSGVLRKAMGRSILSRATVVCAREPVARDAVRAIQNSAPVVETACPAFLLAPADSAASNAVLVRENLLDKPRPRLGVTLTGFSFSRSLVGKDKYRSRRSEKELVPLVEVLRHAVLDLDMDVLLIPHVFRTGADGTLVHGPDSAVTRQVRDLFCAAYPAASARVSMVCGCYDAPTTKALIGTCDLYLSGRLHAAVAALSQEIPTVLLAYSRKFRGFAALLGQQDLVSEALEGRIDGRDVAAKLEHAWRYRTAIRARLAARLPYVAELARLNGRIVKDVLSFAHMPDCSAFSLVTQAWQEDSARLLLLLGDVTA